MDDAGAELLTAAGARELGGRFVAHLAATGIPAGSRVAFAAPNSARLIAAIHGCLLGGWAPVVLSATMTERERAELVGDIDPAIVVDEAMLGAYGAIASADLGDTWACRPIHFTSGTSGRPKAVWSGWLDPDGARALVGEELAIWGFVAEDRHLVCGPVSHSGPLRFALCTLMAGGDLLVLPHFSGAVVRGLLEAGGITSTFMAPTHLQRVLDGPDLLVPPLRLLAHAGSACPEPVRRRAWETFGLDVVREFYGSTEGQFTVCAPREWAERPGTVGRARPGRALRIGADDRIWCQAPPYARFAYWEDPDKTAATWDGDWFTVGDLGRLDDDGFLFIDGRRSDLIISGGVNVYPAEVERIVLDLPGVEQAVAFGADDPEWGQRVCLVVVGAVGDDEILLHCRENLAPYKRPKQIVRAASFPLTHSGKVDRVRVIASTGL